MHTSQWKSPFSPEARPISWKLDKTTPIPPMPVQRNSNFSSCSHHHIPVHTSGSGLQCYQRPGQHPWPQRPGQLLENQAEDSYPTRSQNSILNPRGTQVRSEAMYTAGMSVSNLATNPLLDQKPSSSSEAQLPMWVEILYSITGHCSQKIRHKTETKEENIHSTKTNSENWCLDP